MGHSPAVHQETLQARIFLRITSQPVALAGLRLLDQGGGMPLALVQDPIHSDHAEHIAPVNRSAHRTEPFTNRAVPPRAMGRFDLSPLGHPAPSAGFGLRLGSLGAGQARYLSGPV